MAGRPCLICSNPNRASVETQIVAGVPIARIARQLGINSSSVYRHISAHLAPELRASMRNSAGLDTTALLGRIADIADDSLRARHTAMEAGATATALKAADGELRAINVLMDRLGIDNTETIELLAEARRVVLAIGHFAVHHPASAEPLIELIEQRGSEDLADQLRQLQIKRSQPSIERLEQLEAGRQSA